MITSSTATTAPSSTLSNNLSSCSKLSSHTLLLQVTHRTNTTSTTVEMAGEMVNYVEWNRWESERRRGIVLEIITELQDEEATTDPVAYANALRYLQVLHHDLDAAIEVYDMWRIFLYTYISYAGRDKENSDNEL
jgi:hypothetical protein